MAFLRSFSVLLANSFDHLGVHGFLTFGVERKLLRPKVMIQELLHRRKYCITQNWPLGTALFAVSTTRQTIRKWIQHALAEDPPRAKSLVVTIFGDAIQPHGGSIRLKGLIDLLAPFGINHRLVRTSVFRLVRDHWLHPCRHGRESSYQLTESGQRRFAPDATRRNGTGVGHWWPYR